MPKGIPRNGETPAQRRARHGKTLVRSASALKRRAVRKRIRDRVKDRQETAKIHGGPRGQALVQEVTQQVTRENEAFKLKVQGLTWEQIGQRLGVSPIQARDDVFRAAGDIAADTAERAPELRVIEDAGLDQVKRAMIPLLHGSVPARTTVKVVGRGKSARVLTVPVPNDPLDVARVQGMAAQRLVNVSARRSALLGLDAPVKVAPTDPSGTRRYHELGEAELERLVAEKRAELGALPPASGNGGGGNGQPPREP